ncbi:PLDc_N domain-containing protein [Bacillus luteolus]|uniref:PLDc_N domain-containing protein n=1 Tax=Litchfieldia luteola TaxID=682179 RepID=A0ABR9QFM5_9BACI|nr:PLD nuclease N-terminal domain-containing protein [Cytobacillus luteolus]MBE4907295.1 PLDc_N domain-containing protein [Cytobacillus luteolus]MBP1943224.1 RsiW-degrading membrane proteinase PrsW (M82 family) [Cytobacillus luteolus]
MAELAQLNWALLAPIAIIQLILMVTALVDLIRSEETNGPKLLWVLLILFVSMIGPILYFVVGRKK